MVGLSIIYLILLLLIFSGSGIATLHPFTLYPKSLREGMTIIFRGLEFATVSLGIGLIGIREWVGDPMSYLILTFLLLTGILFVASILCWWYNRRLVKGAFLVIGGCLLMIFYLAPMLAS